MNWLKKIECNTKIIELENKIPSITGLVTTVALNAKVIQIENETPNTSDFINTLDVRMKEFEKSLGSKTEVNNALALRDKNRKKNRKALKV